MYGSDVWCGRSGGYGGWRSNSIYWSTEGNVDAGQMKEEKKGEECMDKKKRLEKEKCKNEINK